MADIGLGVEDDVNLLYVESEQVERIVERAIKDSQTSIYIEILEAERLIKESK